MGFEAYRVLKRFEWRGWEYAPAHACKCDCPGCSLQVGSSCKACPPKSICRCACNIPRESYGGDIWLVEEGHPVKNTMLAHRFAVGDSSIAPIDELLKLPCYRRLTMRPGEGIEETAQPVRIPGRKRELAASSV